MTLTIGRRGPLRGRVRVPGDKSISHRLLFVAALADGESLLRNLAPGADVAATARCLAALGVRLVPEGAALRVYGVGMNGLLRAAGPLDCANSGTTMRLLTGILAGAGHDATLVGDLSLSRRPMGRLLRPLQTMATRIRGAKGGDGDLYPPIVLGSSRLHGRSHHLEVPSAQVKSALLLAGLFADGQTDVVEPSPSRDHTERLLRRVGAPIEGAPGRWRVTWAARLDPPGEVAIPGDPSSAAFLLGAAALDHGSALSAEGISLNPSRRAFLDVLIRMGAAVTEEPGPDDGWEPCGTVRLSGGAPLRAVRIGRAEVPGLIDELPLLAVLACHARGTTVIRGAAELRVKETDRLKAMARGLTALGASVVETQDGLTIEGGAPLRGASLDARNDHRVAMALAVAAGTADGESTLEGSEWVDISYPGFFRELERLSVAA